MVGNINSGTKLADSVASKAREVSALTVDSKHLELKEAAADLRLQTIDLKDTVYEMRNEINKLQNELEFKKKISFNGKVFEYEENGRKIYICNGCEAEKKFVHMTEEKNTDGSHYANCPVCKNEVYFSYPKPIKFDY